MAIYYDKKNDSYKVDVWDGGRRYKSKRFSKKALAEKFERECLNEIDQAKLTGVTYQDLTYDEIYDLWNAGATYRKRETSLVKDAQMHRDFVSPIIGKLRVSQIKPAHFEKIVSVMIKQKLSKASVNKVIQHFKAVFNHSFNNETIARNPGKSFKQLKLDSKEMDYFFQEELDKFLTHTNRKYTGEDRIIHVLYLTLFLTGMRLGEVLGLEWDNSFDFHRNTILLNQIWSNGEMVLSTKGKKDRLIPMPSMLKSELLLLRNTAKGNRVFSRDGVKVIDADNLRGRNWEKDLKEANVKRIRIHDARHTYAALFMMNGGSLYELSKILGHSSIKTTERYAHLSQSHLAGVRDIIKPYISEGADVLKLSPQIHSSKLDDDDFEAVSD